MPGRHRQDRLGVRAVQHRVEELPVQHRVHQVGGGRVLLRGAARDDRGEVEGQRDAASPAVPQPPRGQAVRHEQVVRGAEGVGGAGPAGGVHARRVPEVRGHPWLVDRRPGVDAVGEAVVHDAGVVREAQRGVAGRPAAAVLQRLRQVPVVEGGVRRDPGLEHLVDQPVVEADAARVDRAGAVGLHPRPGHREAVGGQAQAGHQADVVAEPVVVVACHVAGVPARDLARDAAEGVPDRGAASVVPRRALDLVRRGGGAPDEAGWEGQGPGVGLGRVGIGRGGRHRSGWSLRWRVVAHALRAPSMIPLMICRPNSTKTASSGSVATAVPVNISE